MLAFPSYSVLRIAFLSEEHAVYAARSLAVDAELQVGKAFKEITTDGKETIMCVDPQFFSPRRR